MVANPQKSDDEPALPGRPPSDPHPSAPPHGRPLSDRPPTEPPPPVRPSAEPPPVDRSPVERSPVERPLAGRPPPERPPVEQPSTERPPAEPPSSAPSSARPPAGRRGGTRRRPRREPPLAWWAAFAALGGAALWLGSWRVALVGVLAWCLYQFALVPTLCRVLTPQGYACTERARGRLFACGPDHQRVKNDALWRLVGRRRSRSRDNGADVHDDTGVVVISGDVRSRLNALDRALLLLAFAGTVAAVAATLYGLLR